MYNSPSNTYFIILLLEACTLSPLCFMYLYTTWPYLLQSSPTLRQLLPSSYHGKLSENRCMWASRGVSAMNNVITKWHIVASVSMGLPENHQLVRVLSFRTIGTWRFMLSIRIWIIVIASTIIVLSRWKVERRRKSGVRQFAHFSNLLVWYFSDACQQS